MTDRKPLVLVSGQVQEIPASDTLAVPNGSVDLTTDVTGDLPLSSLAQGTARSVLGVAGNATADYAPIQGFASAVMRVDNTGTGIAFGQVNLSNNSAVTGTLFTTVGGTGISSYTKGDMIFCSSANTLSKAPGNITTTKKYLGSQGDGTNAAAPSWEQVSLTAGVTGRLPYANIDQASPSVLLGNPTASTADVSAITLAGTLAFSGTTLTDNEQVIIALTNTATSSTTLGSVTGLSFTAAANSTYEIRGMIVFESAATTTGIGLALDVPAGANVAGHFTHMTAATTVGGGNFITDATAGSISSGVTTANVNNPAPFHAVVANGATSGTVQLQVRSEIAASTVTVKTGVTYLVVKKLS